MIASLSKSTLKQYSVCFNQWWQYCYTNNHEKFDSSTSIIIKFLTDQYNNGASYGTINSFRSALSMLLGNDISQDKSIKRLIKGVFRSRPSLPKYANTWDPQIVLSHISKWTPHTELSLEKLTKKLVSLLALCTAHRVQTFSLIKLSNIIISDSGVKINIVDLIKTSGPGRDQPVLYLPYFNDNLDICPATTLVDYISFTKELRSTSSDHLLITVKRPHRNATAQSISRWIKQVLQESGVDAAVFSAHSARHAATALTYSAGSATQSESWPPIQEIATSDGPVQSPASQRLVARAGPPPPRHSSGTWAGPPVGAPSDGPCRLFLRYDLLPFSGDGLASEVCGLLFLPLC
ncbi:uncharacterized protein LOC125488734 [Plutella xylostella]|uniref:uncharacterized protein LOC125488734 n=1 Tax=Plutella xylostella TaxID=51655 RepID=UPI0020324983|nr:uncharacterized protein LOC125488734 [Plutella xylostella]